MRALKALIGLGLAPIAWASAVATVRLAVRLQPEHLGSHPLSLYGLLAGMLLWMIFYFARPHPTRTYILGHELTHALWALVMGARVSRLRVGARGGSVQVSKTNWLITLAPYFFPFYTVLVIALIFAAGSFLDLRPYEPFSLGLIGFTYAFHVTFTIEMLLVRQPDIIEQGRLFSYSVILLINAIGLGCWIVAAGSPTFEDYKVLLSEELEKTWQSLGWAFQWVQKTARGLLNKG